MAGQGPFPWGPGWAKLDGAAAAGVEQPTQAAELKVTVGPASAGGRVPQRDAKHFITVGGIAWCVTAAIAGVVLTLQCAGGARGPGVGSGPIVLALAELVFGLLGSALIAACGRRAALRDGDPGRGDDAGRDRDPGRDGDPGRDDDPGRDGGAGRDDDAGRDGGPGRDDDAGRNDDAGRKAPYPGPGDQRVRGTGRTSGGRSPDRR
jgi:hypothetical protein